MRLPGVTLLALAVALPAVAAAEGSADTCDTAYDCAVLQVNQHRFQEAIDSLEEVLAASPRDLKALNLLGIALTGAGRVADANERFREALRIDPGFYPSRKNLAINELDHGRLSEAQRQLEEVLKRVPGDEIAHVHLAEVYFQRRKFRAALQHYERSGERIARKPGWILHYAACLLDQGQVKKAVAVLDRLPADAANHRFEAGVTLGRAGRHAEAARFFASSRKGYSDPYAAGYNQVLMLIEGSDHAGAIRVAEELFAAGIQKAELYNLAARAYREAGQIQKAYDALRTATRLAPKDEDNYIDLAMICIDHHNYDLGLEVVGVGLHHLPDSWLLYLQRGVLQAMKAQLGQAEKEFEAAHRLAPQQVAPYAALAMVWMQSGQATKAVEVLRKQAALPGTDHVVPYTFAMALMRSGVDPAGPEAVEAVEALRASVQRKPDFAPSRTELGRLLLKRDDVDGAIRELERATALDPASAVAIYNLAQAYRKKGDRERAGELLARVSRLNEQQRGEDPDGEMKRVVVRLVREGAAGESARPTGKP